MTRLLTAFLLTILSAVYASATTADTILKSAADRYQRLKTISASYSATSGSEKMNGTIVTSGDKFHISSPQLSTWYDGRTQWTYSPAGTHTVQLLPLDKKASIRKAVVTFDAKTLYPTLIRLTTDNNAILSIKVTNVVAGKKYPLSTFVFDKKKYPGAEIIDLR